MIKLRRPHCIRGSANIIGVFVLLLVTIMIIGSTAAFGVLFYVPEPTATNPSVDFDFEHDNTGTTDTIVIEHTSGDRVPSNAVRIEVESSDIPSNEQGVYWANISDDEYVYENRIEITGDVYNIDDPVDFDDVLVEIYAEGNGEDWLIDRWS